MARRASLVALLIYVTLDLSLPAMPGAFVFEAADSVESVHGGRGRVGIVVVAPLVADVPALAACHADVPEHRRRDVAVHIAPHRSVNRLARATLASAASPPASLSDPH